MQPRIMFVDDDPLSLEVLQDQLRGDLSQWRMEFFADGQVAWDHMIQSPVDVVVSDVMMRDFDGLKLLKRIRGN